LTRILTSHIYFIGPNIKTPLVYKSRSPKHVMVLTSGRGGGSVGGGSVGGGTVGWGSGAARSFGSCSASIENNSDTDGGEN